MIRFKDIIKSFGQLREIYNSLVFSTTLGRERLLNTLMCSDRETLDIEYNHIEELIGGDLSRTKMLLMHFRDIRGSIERLSTGAVLSEVELFELKHFSFYVGKISRLEEVKIDPIDEIFDILDPDKSGVVNFYIYDSYNPILTTLRKEENHLEIAKVEEQVRQELSLLLREHKDRLKIAIDRIAEIDLLIAKVEYIEREHLSRPEFVEYGKTSYNTLFNPYLRSIIEEYQAVDISLVAATTLITGANMSGKTMLLKTVALAQYLVQFGLFAPATKAQVALVDDIFLLVGDHQQESEGLSSYAAEIIHVSKIIDTIEQGGEYLVLLDELARTTSPIEGALIVDATTLLLNEMNTMALITTHYSALKSGARRLRVRGFMENKHEERVTRYNISRFIDYSLSEVDEKDSNDSSSEAIRIAEILDANKKLIKKTKELIW